MTDDQRIALLKLHQDLMARIEPLWKAVKPLLDDRACVERMIVEDINSQIVVRFLDPSQTVCVLEKCKTETLRNTLDMSSIDGGI